MKRLIALIVLATATLTSTAQTDGQLSGAWEYNDDHVKHIAVFVDGYFSHSRYDPTGKQFISTRGGIYNAKDGQIQVVWQYDTDKATASESLETWLGQVTTFEFTENKLSLQIDIAGRPDVWTRIDRNENPLAGVWRISGRKRGDDLRQMPLRDRRTLKVLSGSRFQWIAINIKTGEFSGTGGGTYTFENGTYIENIEFFSRDNSRVGASLTFDGKIENGNWHHSGLSSKGDPIYEIWEKLVD